MKKIFVGKKIKKLRGQRTLREFAALCDILPKTLLNIENNKVEPRLDTVFKIADGLNIEYGEILEILKP